MMRVIHTAYVTLPLLPETVPEQGQSASLLKEGHLAVLSAPGEALLNQAFSLPLFWNGLLVR